MNLNHNNFSSSLTQPEKLFELFNTLELTNPQSFLRLVGLKSAEVHFCPIVLVALMVCNVPNRSSGLAKKFVDRFI